MSEIQINQALPENQGPSAPKGSKNHAVWLILLVVVAVLAAVGWWMWKNQKLGPLNFGTKPQPAYLEGMKVEPTRQLPDNFPAEVLPEQAIPERADTLTYPDGRKDITVIYISQEPMGELLLANALNLSRLGWQIKQNQALEKSAVILAEKDNTTLMVTLVPEKIQGTKVTFLYQK